MTVEAHPHAVAFVGSYAAPDSPGIYAVAFDPTLGLRILDVWSGIGNPSFLTHHPHGPYLYAVGETSPGTVHAFRVDQGDGRTRLIPLGRRPSSGDHPCHLSVDSRGRWIAASNYGTGTVTLFPIRPDGSLGESSASVRQAGGGPHPRQDRAHAHASVFSPDDRALVVADLGTDQVAVYAVDPDAGVLTLRNAVQMAPGAGPRHLAFHPSGAHLFVLNELDNTVTLLDWDAGDARIRQTLSTLPVSTPENLAADIHVAANGRHVYVSNRGHDSLAIFSFDPAAGLALTATRPSGGVTPRGFRLAPEGRHVWVANQETGEVVVMPLLEDGNDIGEPSARVHVPRASCVSFNGAR